jgi:hypothetical protein
MSEKRTEFLEKLKALPMDELVKYESAAVTAGRITDVIGISCFLLMFFFPVELTFLFCVPIVFVVANMGAGFNKSLIEIRQILANPKRVDK